MRWSLNLGSIAGTPIRIHITFLLFLVWLATIYYSHGGAEAAWRGTIFIVLRVENSAGHPEAGPPVAGS